MGHILLALYSFPLFAFHTFAFAAISMDALTHSRSTHIHHGAQNNASNCENVRFALRSMQMKRKHVDGSEGMISSQWIRVRGNRFLFRIPFSLGSDRAISVVAFVFFFSNETAHINSYRTDCIVRLIQQNSCSPVLKMLSDCVPETAIANNTTTVLCIKFIFFTINFFFSSIFFFFFPLCNSIFPTLTNQ